MEEKLREHLLELLAGRSAHVDLETVLREFPVELINRRPEHSPHTAWELLEHIRIAQWDILEFSRDAGHISPEFPAGYWPDAATAASADDWRRAVRQTLDDLQAVRDLISDSATDLFARIPHGSGQTVLREALLVADHNAYHLGQLVLLRRLLEDREKKDAPS